MGKALKDTKIKVPDAAGPLKKGLPLSAVMGKGGLYNLFRGVPAGPNMKVPGFKSLMKRSAEARKSKHR